MSRIGKKPVPLPDKVSVEVDGQHVLVRGDKGELSWEVPGGISVEVRDGQVVTQRRSEEKRVRALHGLARSLIANMVQGVAQGFERKLLIEGIGYRAQLLPGGRVLGLNLGYSHPIDFELPDGVEARIERPTEIVVKGIDKQLVGEVAAQIRRLRPVEPFKGKGIRYEGEKVRRKVGKAGA